MVFIVGKSGSGKSTMMNILGLLDTYDKGEYLIDGKCSKTLSEKEKDTFRALKIGFVFQEFHIINEYTIGQNISLPLEIQHSENNARKVKQVLNKVGLEDYENRKPTEISGGQKQRVAIARAIIKDPDVILADEPTGSLDSVNGGEIFNLLQELSKEKLVVVISHDIESAHKYADQIIELKDGKIYKIYEGDGGAEPVRFVVDKVTTKDIEEYNNILDKGKKVVITKVKEKKASPKSQPKQKIEVSGKINLPFKSALKLSLFSMKNKWVRTLFTILLSTLAIAFFGFADIIAQFNSDNLIIQELNHQNNGFVNIGVEEVKDYGIFKGYTTTEFLSTQQEQFDKLNLNSYPRRNFMVPPFFFSMDNYREFLPRNKFGQYYDPRLVSFTECNDVSSLGVKIIEGRAPEEYNEILVNSYHMQNWEVFGFDELTKVTSFSQIENREFYFNTGFEEVFCFKIVGLVEVDLSSYDEISSIKAKTNSLTEEQREILYNFRRNFDEINNIYVREGFFEIFEAKTANSRLFNNNLYLDNSFFNIRNHVEKITPKMFDHINVATKEGVVYENIGDNKIVLSLSIVKELLPDSRNFIGTVQEYCGTYDIFGKKIRLECNFFTSPYNKEGVFDREFEIIGVYEFQNSIFVSPNIVEELFTDSVYVYKIPATTNSERLNVINTVNNFGEFEDSEIVYKFHISCENYIQIRQINVFFTLFVSVFSILAIVLCVFAMILTYTFISQSIILRKKDIGIIRSLGARKKDIAGIFIIEGVIIAIFEIILGAIGCYFGYRLLDYYFISRIGIIAERYSIVAFELRQVVLIICATLLAVSLSIVLPIFRITKKQPVDAIRN